MKQFEYQQVEYSKYPSPEELNDFLQYFIETHADEYNMSDICEQCGDRVITYKMTLD